MKILFATSEAHPLCKTGGLGDVSASLPAALHHLGQEVRLVLPAYRTVLDRIGPARIVARLSAPGVPEPLRILESEMPDSGVPLWLVDAPALYDRPGNPYTGPGGHDWPDNALRFAAFGHAVVELASDRAGLEWRADVLHCHDWQTGLAPALLTREKRRPATIFTIHNLAYRGLFPRAAFDALHLPADLWSPDAMEFYGEFAFIKGGIAFADRVTTVSPTYADEIRTPEFGWGLEGLLNHRGDHLVGILNGIDYRAWDPAGDHLIPATYSTDDLSGKARDKRELQERMGLPQRDDIPLMGVVSRLAEQKGLDLIVGALPRIFEREVQLVVLGTGDKGIEAELTAAAERHPEHVRVRIGYDEALAHCIEAGTDLFLMPSRFEPCGLNQIYSLRYGTLPVVRRTGGLADTVVDATADALAGGRATGFVFDDASVDGLTGAIDRALTLYHEPETWRQMMRTAMVQDFSWEKSAARYLDLYQGAIDAPRRH